MNTPKKDPGLAKSSDLAGTTSNCRPTHETPPAGILARSDDFSPSVRSSSAFIPASKATRPTRNDSSTNLGAAAPDQTTLEATIRSIQLDLNDLNITDLLSKWSTNSNFEEIKKQIINIGLKELTSYTNLVFLRHTPTFTNYLNPEEQFYLGLMFLKDPTTARHLCDTFFIGNLLVDSLQASPSLNEKERYAFLRACLMHDFGKINVPNTILTSPNPLTDYEKALFDRHEITSVLIVRSIRTQLANTLPDLLEYTIATHHDYPTEYPLNNPRPKTDNIHKDVLTLLIFLADNIAAMGQPRPYRKYRITPEEIKNLTLFNLNTRIAHHNHDQEYLRSFCEQNPNLTNKLLDVIISAPDFKHWYGAQTNCQSPH